MNPKIAINKPITIYVGDIPIFCNLVKVIVILSSVFLKTSKESLRDLDIAYLIGM